MKKVVISLFFPWFKETLERSGSRSVTLQMLSPSYIFIITTHNCHQVQCLIWYNYTGVYIVIFDHPPPHLWDSLFFLCVHWGEGGTYGPPPQNLLELITKKDAILRHSPVLMHFSPSPPPPSFSPSPYLIFIPVHLNFSFFPCGHFQPKSCSEIRSNKFCWSPNVDP